MTITISSNEPSTIDRVLQLLRREKVPFSFQPERTDKPLTKEEALANIDADENAKAFYADFIDALEWSNAKARGEVEQGQSLSDFLNEVQLELEEENQLTHAH